MVDNNPDDLFSRLRKLSKREREVLVLRCQGMKYVDIGKALYIAESTVKEDISRIYLKLGLDVLRPSERLKVLYDTICPFLKSRKPTGEAAGSTPEEVVDGEVVQDKEEKPIPKKIMDMVEKDGKTIVPWAPAPLVALNHPPSRRSIWPVVLVLGVVLGICLGAVGVYMFLRPGNGPNPSVPQPTPTIHPQAPVDTATATSAPTDTAVPTLTEVATTVSPPTNTPFVPPADGILFQDNFDNGMSPDWQLYTGKWIVANGKLTKLPEESGNLYQWIGLEKPEWKNYIVSLAIKEVRPQTEESAIAIVVRDNTTQPQYIGAELDFWPHIYLSLISTDNTRNSAIAGQNKDFTFPMGSDTTMELEVKDNTYTLRVSGQQIQVVSLPGYDSGGIRIGLNCGADIECPTFDNVKVMYLP